MPRYFFHISDGVREHDSEGTECDDVAAARQQAIQFAGQVLHDSPKVLAESDDFRVEVTNEQGLSLFTVVAMALDSAAMWTDPKPSSG